MNSPTPVDRMVDAALRLMTRGDRAAAEELLAQALRHEPGHARARAAMAQLLEATAPRAHHPTEPALALPTAESPTARVRREDFEDERDRKAVTTRQYGADSPEAQAIRAAAKAKREADAAAMRRTDLDSLLGHRRAAAPPPSNTFDPRPEDSTLPGKAPGATARGPADTDEQDDGSPGLLRRPPPEATALDVSLERALNDEPAPTSTDLPQLAAASHRSDGATDRHLSLVPGGHTGTSSTHPSLLPVHGKKEAPLVEAPAGRRSGPHAAVGPEWALEVQTGPHAGQLVALGRKPLVLGVGVGPLDFGGDPFASPGHASLFLRGADVFVGDGESASGTWVTLDGVARLGPGEDFSVGLQRLRYLGPLDAPARAGFLEYGAPAPGATWRLEERLVGARPARVWLLRGIVTVGRAKAAAVRFAGDESLAERHAELRPTAQGLEVVDQSGGKGTWVCLPRGGERRVPVNGRVRLGTTVLRLVAR